jgi:hypothetical protein
MVSWQSVARKCYSEPEVFVKKSQVPNPKTAKGRDGKKLFSRSLGLPQGETENWRMALATGECLHVKAYRGFYACHLDAFHPHTDPIKHLIGDVIL